MGPMESTDIDISVAIDIIFLSHRAVRSLLPHVRENVRGMRENESSRGRGRSLADR